MAVEIKKSVLDGIAEKASFIAEMYEAESANDQQDKAYSRSCYLQGMSYVLEQFGYIFQYTDNTHIYIDTIDNVNRRIKNGRS